MTANTPDDAPDNPDGAWFALVRPVGWAQAVDPSKTPAPEPGTGADPSVSTRATRRPREPDTDAGEAAGPAAGNAPAGSHVGETSGVHNPAGSTSRQVVDWRSDAGGSIGSTSAHDRDPGDDVRSPAGARRSQVFDVDREDDGDEEPFGGGPSGRRRRPRRRWLVLGVVVIAAVGTGSWIVTHGDSTGTASEPAGPAATAEVARETISATEEWGGRLGHGDPFEVAAAGQGTVTGIAERDSNVERGTELHRVDEHPVTAMFGDIPMYRELQSGDTGADVLQLEDNLSQLGYEGFDVDDEFTSATAEAVQQWQEDLGVEETGVVTPVDVIFVPQGGGVGTVHASVGDVVQAGSPVLDISGSEQVVSFEVDVRDRGLVEVDTEVSVLLPGGEEVIGTVTAADVVEVAPEGNADEEAPGAEDTVVEVEAAVGDEVDEALLGSPVDVVVEVDEREDVLVVPVNALVARSEGGHGLEVVADDGTTSIVEVETGLFADGKVEVTGDGIDEGTVVGVAGR